MPTVEGLTPTILWTTLYGILALCILFMLVYKVYEAVRTIIERRKQAREAEKPDFAEAVSQKVIEKLEPRFQDIEDNLAKEKSRLDNHDQLISGFQTAQSETRSGLVAICEYLMAIAQYGSIGSDRKELQDATAKMTQYLASKIGGGNST